MKKIEAGKAFFMQSKNIKVNYLLLTRIRSSPGAFADMPRSVRCCCILPSQGGEFDGEGVLVSVC